MTLNTLADGLAQAYALKNSKLADQIPRGLRAKTDILQERFRARMDALGISDAMQADLTAKARRGIQRLVNACESPIEKSLAPWLVMQDYGPGFGTIPPVVHIPKEDEEGPVGDLVIVPQFAFVRYRFDFALVANTAERLRILAVECDGDVHLDNADRDRKRDAYLARWGIATIRTIGERIYNEPEEVSQRIIDAFLSHAGA